MKNEDGTVQSMDAEVAGPGFTESEVVGLAEIEAAALRIAGVAVHTPLVELHLAGLCGYGPPRSIRLKAENLQPMGAFKIRGAANRILALTAGERQRGVVTYSSGNHAQAVAWAARSIGVRAVVVMPSNAPAVKREATLALGAEVVEVGAASSERRARAEALVREQGLVLVPPYDDRAVIAGQGSCGLEIVADWPEVDLVVAPVGGGGLLAGVAAAIKQQRPGVQVWGVEPLLAADAAESLRLGRIVSWTSDQTCRTMADGLRTQSLGTLNFLHLQRFVDGMLAVTEAEIADAMQVILQSARLVAEPSGAVALAALLFHADELPEFNHAAVILSGGNVDRTLPAGREPGGARRV